MEETRRPRSSHESAVYDEDDIRLTRDFCFVESRLDCISPLMDILHYTSLHLCVLLSAELVVYLLGISKRRPLSAVALLFLARMSFLPLESFLHRIVDSILVCNERPRDLGVFDSSVTCLQAGAFNCKSCIVRAGQLNFDMQEAVQRL